MKKLNVVIVTVILALCCNTIFASTTLYSTLEKNEETKLKMQTKNVFE